MANAAVLAAVKEQLDAIATRGRNPSQSGWLEILPVLEKRLGYLRNNPGYFVVTTKKSETFDHPDVAVLAPIEDCNVVSVG